MRKSIHLRWIEHAEAKSVREHAGLQRAASEPPVNIVHATTSPSWLDWPRPLTRTLGYTVAAVRSLSVTARIWAKAASRAAFRPSPREVDYDRVLVAVLITDIVDSTKWVAEVGDRDWRIVLDRHHDATRHHIKRFGGREVGNRGDGFVGIFDSPSRAVRCAAAITNTIAPLGISLRSGVHAGEVYLRRGEIGGIAVHIAARIAATAHPGETCVSKTVRDLVVGSGLVFEDRGTHQLRGLPKEIHLYAMRGFDASVALPTGLRMAAPPLAPQSAGRWTASIAHNADEAWSWDELGYSSADAGSKGQGIWFASTFLVGEDLATGRLIRLLPDYAPVKEDLGAVYPHRRSTPSIARRAARRKAPPTIIGGCGFCDGLGQIIIGGKLTNSP